MKLKVTGLGRVDEKNRERDARVYKFRRDDNAWRRVLEEGVALPCIIK